MTYNCHCPRELITAISQGVRTNHSTNDAETTVSLLGIIIRGPNTLQNRFYIGKTVKFRTPGISEIKM